MQDAIVGIVVYSMMVALGEMVKSCSRCGSSDVQVALYPVSGAWVHYATRFGVQSLSVLY